jgi:hypothetical protein
VRSRFATAETAGVVGDLWASVRKASVAAKPPSCLAKNAPRLGGCTADHCSALYFQGMARTAPVLSVKPAQLGACCSVAGCPNDPVQVDGQLICVLHAPDDHVREVMLLAEELLERACARQRIWDA